MSFVIEQPKRQPMPELQQPSVYSPTQTSSAHPLIDSVNSSSPRSDHHNNPNSLQNPTGPTGVNESKSQYVTIDFGTAPTALPPPSYHATLIPPSGLIDHNSNSLQLQDVSSSNNNNSNKNSNTFDSFDMDERRCRICFEGEKVTYESQTSSFNRLSSESQQYQYHHSHDKKPSDSKSEDRLISPCLCKGSSRYIHMSCLEKWRAMAPRAESKFKCDTCHYEYSIYRTRTAKILGNIWFLRSISVLIVILITYGVAWIGRVLNNHAWQWKDQIFQVDSAMLRILGLDKLDVLFGLMGMAILGIVIMGTTYCIGAVLTTSVCCFCCSRQESQNEDNEENANMCSNDCVNGSLCSFCSCNCDGGGGGGGEFIVILILVAIIAAGLFLVFGGVYALVSKISQRALKFMKETILEVK